MLFPIAFVNVSSEETIDQKSSYYTPKSIDIDDQNQLILVRKIS